MFANESKREGEKMKKQITINKEEMEQILQKHFKIDKTMIFYTFGGMINPWRMEVSYYE